MFPHAVVFNFKAIKTLGKGDAHSRFGFRERYVPVSVSLADTFDGEPKHISAKDPNEPLKKFWEALVRQGEILRETIRRRYVPEDYQLLSKR